MSAELGDEADLVRVALPVQDVLHHFLPPTREAEVSLLELGDLVAPLGVARLVPDGGFEGSGSGHGVVLGRAGRSVEGKDSVDHCRASHERPVTTQESKSSTWSFGLRSQRNKPKFGLGRDEMK